MDMHDRNGNPLGFFVTAHPGDGISPGGYIRVVHATETARSITSRPWAWFEVNRSTN